ncbi:hypothetical protein KY46_04460 [Photobacterium halotolerans]|uniref:Uncharacterized protein n=1 Tax=Photobacterium halotolerans TaxID=265726 RepID=A0A0F5VG51_9GAMM|nr:hypothetical protein KY46_04460 [Photobacterium halotolerans]
MPASWLRMRNEKPNDKGFSPLTDATVTDKCYYQATINARMIWQPVQFLYIASLAAGGQQLKHG